MTLSPLADAALQEMCAIWEPEPAHTIRQESGFDWTPGSHVVRVRATSREIEGAERVRLSVETDFLQDVPLADKTFCARLASMAHILTATYSLVYPLAEIRKNHPWPAKLTLFSSAYAECGDGCTARSLVGQDGDHAADPRRR